jgi:quinoprotein glucose dehydrogenase
MDALLDAALEKDPEIRMAAALALGGLKRREVAYYLNDEDPRIVVEAARAIHDIPIPEAMSSLASMADVEKGGVRMALDFVLPIYRRVIDAAFQLGQTEHAAALSAFAANAQLPESLRVEAIEALSNWLEPLPGNRVTGAWNPIGPRDPRSVRIPFSLEINGLLKSESLTLRQAAVRAAGMLKMQSVANQVLECFRDARLPASLRLSALNALGRMDDFQLASALREALKDADPGIRKAGVEWMGRLPSERAVGLLSDVLDQGSVEEKRKAFVQLADIPGSAVDGIFLKWLIFLNRGQVPSELREDLLAGARKRNNRSLDRRIEEYRQNKDSSEERPRIE